MNLANLGVYFNCCPPDPGRMNTIGFDCFIDFNIYEKGKRNCLINKG